MRRHVPFDRGWLWLAGADAVVLGGLALIDLRLLVAVLIAAAWLLLVAIGGMTDGGGRL